MILNYIQKRYSILFKPHTSKKLQQKYNTDRIRRKMTETNGKTADSKNKCKPV